LDLNRLIGSAGVRAGTLAALLLSVSALVVRDRIAASGAEGALFLLAVGAGVVALLGMIHSFRRLYAGWMRFAEVLQKVVVSILFAAFYFLLVPWFLVMVRILDPLRLRTRSESESFWIPKRRQGIDGKSLSRMG
jgi:hypothetical protein